MQARLVNILLSRNMMESLPKQVAAHEIPLMELVHGAGSVSLNPAIPSDEYREIEPGAETEYQRLARAYKINKDRNIPNVEVVYGKEEEGKINKFYLNYERNMSRFITPVMKAVTEAAKPDIARVDPDLLSIKGVKARLDEMGILYKEKEGLQVLVDRLVAAQEEKPVAKTETGGIMVAVGAQS